MNIDAYNLCREKQICNRS